MDIFDVGIIGGGVAGLSAAVNMGSQGNSIVLFEATTKLGGCAGRSHLIENVLGWPTGFVGNDFARDARRQATKFGVTIYTGAPITSFNRDEETGLFTLFADVGEFPVELPMQFKTILLTIGLEPQQADIELIGQPQGILYSRDLVTTQPYERVLVYGGGNAAAQAACFYSKIGSEVTLVARSLSMDNAQRVNLENCDVDTIIIGEIQTIERQADQGDNLVSITTPENTITLPHINLIHCFLGSIPEGCVEWLEGVITLHPLKYIVTDAHGHTNVPGVFAAGTCVYGCVNQVACAAGSGVSVGQAINFYLMKFEDESYG